MESKSLPESKQSEEIALQPQVSDDRDSSEFPSNTTHLNFTSKKNMWIVGCTLGLLLLFMGGLFAFYKKGKESVSPPVLLIPSPSPDLGPSLFPTITPTASPISSPKITLRPSSTAIPTPKSTSSPTPTPTPTSTPTPTPTATPTPTPTPRTPNPPFMNINYPSENQSITMNTSQQFCVVDLPAGGDTSGLQRKHLVNNQAWSTYVDHYTLCFEPIEGQNTFTLQYKNSYGDESTMYTRQFLFHRE